MSFRALHNTVLTLGLAVFATFSLSAEPIAVRQTQGSTRGFLLMRSEDGKILAHGELNQVAHGERVTTRLVFRFRDGSIDDDTTVYTQHDTFQLVSDHHIQKGPFFPTPADYFVDVPTGNVTSRSVGKNGEEKVQVEHMDLPPDTSNGLVGTLLLNVPHDGPEFKVGMVAPTGKGRLVKLNISPEGQGTFSDVGVVQKAAIFRIKIELGGVAGVVAPVIGKQPADIMVWVLEGPAPGFVREVGPLYNGGPTVSIELSGASFAHRAPLKPKPQKN